VWAAWARGLWALLAAVAAFGAIAQLVLTAKQAIMPGFGLDPMALRLLVVQYFSFFTTLSNLLVVVLAIGLAAGGGGWASGSTGRAGVFWRWLLLTTVPSIVVTGSVYRLMLRPLSDATGFPAVVNDVQHVVVPLGTVLVWLVMGPRGWIRHRQLPSILIFPLLYYAWTLIHGAAIDWYPYPFVDVTQLGYPRALLAGGIILVLLLVLAEVAHGVDLLLCRFVRARHR
jgi:hypothetical protein